MILNIPCVPLFLSSPLSFSLSPSKEKKKKHVYINLLKWFVKMKAIEIYNNLCKLLKILRNFSSQTMWQSQLTSGMLYSNRIMDYWKS